MQVTTIAGYKWHIKYKDTGGMTVKDWTRIWQPIVSLRKLIWLLDPEDFKARRNYQKQGNSFHTDKKVNHQAAIANINV